MKKFFRNGFVHWTFGAFVAVGIFVWFFLLGPYLAPYPTCTFRYKLSAEVMTPDGLRTGSSVWEVSYSHSSDYGGGEQPINQIVGDAVYVDLGRDKNLLITLTPNYSGRKTIAEGEINFSHRDGPMSPFALPLKVFDLTWWWNDVDRLCRDFAALGPSASATIPFSYLPTLVTFLDIHDPNSVTVIQPYSLGDQFGPGYELKQVNLISSTENPTVKIEDIFDWWPVKTKQWQREKGTSTNVNDPLIDQLGYDAFRGFKT
jgi:hypothetical protein